MKKDNQTSIYLKELIAGKLTTKAYNYLFSYSKNFIYGYSNYLPKHMTIDDIVSHAITQAYLSREQYDPEISYEVTWFNTIVLNYAKIEYKKHNNIDGWKHIPQKSFAPNQVRIDNETTVSIFDTLDLVEEIDLDNLLINSKDISEQVRLYVLEQDFKELYARLYEIPEGEPLNGIYRRYDLITYEELAIKFNTTVIKVNNVIHRQKMKVITHFNKINKNKTI